MIFEEEEKMNKTEKVLVKILENNEGLEEFLKRKTMDGMYEFVLNKDSSISEEEFDESVAKLLEDYSLLGVKKVNENTLVNVSGGAVELGRKVTSAGLAALMLLPAFPPSVGAVNSGELQAIGGRLRKFASDSKEFISDKWKNTKESIKNHPIISATIATATTLAMITIVVIASRHSKPDGSSTLNSSNNRPKRRFRKPPPQLKSEPRFIHPRNIRLLENWANYSDNRSVRVGSKCGSLLRNFIKSGNFSGSFDEAKAEDAVLKLGGSKDMEGVKKAVERVLNGVAGKGGFRRELGHEEKMIYRFLTKCAVYGYSGDGAPIFSSLSTALNSWSKDKVEDNIPRDTDDLRLFPPHESCMEYKNDENDEKLAECRSLFFNC